MARQPDFQDVNNFLGKCSEEMMRYIELQINFAKDVRTYQLEYTVSNEEFAHEYGCEVSHVLNLRKGATDISIKDMAKLRTLYANRIAEERARLKVAGE